MAGLTIALADDAKPGERLGHWKAVIATIDFDASYPTGGEPFDALAKTALGLTEIEAVIPLGTAPGDMTLCHVPSTGKILAYFGDAEMTNATDLSLVTGVRVLVLGR